MPAKVLKKSNNKVLAGVCAGIAEYFGWDPVLVRILFILVALLGGASLLAYIILLIIMPSPDSN